jgi:hypothetical protein
MYCLANRLRGWTFIECGEDAMRADMAKVIVERPRFGSRAGQGKGYARRWQQMPLEDAPRREGIGLRGGGTKRFNEHLGPLRRFLRRQVGRPWNKVFSEICEHIRLDSAVQSHVRDHIDDIVVTRVMVVDGELCGASGYPLRPYGWTEFYVCPRTGLLRKIKRPRRQTIEPPADWIKIDDTRGYRRMSGVWYEVSLSPLARGYAEQFDVVLRRRVDQADLHLCTLTHQASAWASGRRQLNKREIRRLGLNKLRPAHED